MHDGDAPRDRFAWGAGILPALAVVLLVLALPIGLMLAYSLWRFVPGRPAVPDLTAANYVRLLGDRYYLGVIAGTLRLGLIVTAGTLLLGYPTAYCLSRLRGRLQSVLVYLVFVPMMVGLVVRAYGWIVVLGYNGALNAALLQLGLVRRPLRLLNTELAVVFGLIEVLLPFMVMPLLSALEKVPVQAEEAARMLGAVPGQVFRKVTWPLSRPGIVSGCLMVFSLAITAYALPAILGGAKVTTISGIAYDSMLVSYNWPFGAAVGITMITVSTALIYAYLRLAGRSPA